MGISLYLVKKLEGIIELVESNKDRAIGHCRDWLLRLHMKPRSLLHAHSNRREGFITVGVLLVIVLACSLYVPFLSDASTGASALDSQCTLSLLSGSTYVRISGSDTWEEAVDAMTLNVGNRVKTAADSHAVLTFFEGSTLTLEPDTEIEIQRVERVDKLRTEIVMKQWIGKTWSKVVKMADPGSRFEIQAGSAWAMVRGTMFETEVDNTGSTTVRTTEGLVSVGAQNEEVEVPAGEQVSVQCGTSPSEPQFMPVPDNQFIIMVTMPAVASVCDPSGASTGYLPNGIGFNQIAGSQSSLPGDGTQIIRIPDPEAGDYHIALRSIDKGTIQYTLAVLSGQDIAFTQIGTHEDGAGSEWLVTVNLQYADGQFLGASASDLQPLGDDGKEKLVITKRAKELAQPISTLHDTDADATMDLPPVRNGDVPPGLEVAPGLDEGYVPPGLEAAPGLDDGDVPPGLEAAPAADPPAAPAADPPVAPAADPPAAPPNGGPPGLAVAHGPDGGQVPPGRS